MHFKYTFGFLALLALLSSCLDEYNPPEITQSESVLVVEGNISDKATTINLSSTGQLGGDETFPILNARVVLESENSNLSENLLQKGSGVYHLEVPLSFDGRYRVRIETESEVYVSEYQTLLTTPAIDSVGWEDIDGFFQVHVSTHDDSNSTRYYLWQFEETWQYRSRYPSFFIYNEIEGLIPRTRDQQITTCWSTEPSTSVLVGTTVNLTDDVVFKEPIQRIEPSGSLKLSSRYSILVKQFALTKEAYEFWELLKKNSESVGTFFDPQPSQLPTNVTSISNPDRPVIGFITASQEQQERYFVSRRDLPFADIPSTTFSECVIDTIPDNREDIDAWFSNDFNVPIQEAFNENTGGILGYESARRICVDCRSFGGVTVEPDFWRN